MNGFFKPGDTFSARLAYDTGTPGSASQFIATYPGAVKEFRFSYSNGYEGSATAGTAGVWNDYPIGVNNLLIDEFSVESRLGDGLEAPPIGDAHIVNLNAFVLDSSGSVFSSLNLVPLPPLANVTGTRFETIYQNGTGTSYVVGRILSVERIGLNMQPTANAGPDQAIHAGQVVTLDGSQSFDDDTPTASLLFSWTLTTRPDGSGATLDGGDTPNPTFLADLPGTYVATLVVTDGDGLTSAPDAVTVSSLNAPPIAAAGPEQVAVVGQPVVLDGVASFDPDGDELLFHWGLRVPSGSVVTLSDVDTARPWFVPDVPGTYTATLMVLDPYGASSTAETRVSAITAEDFVENEAAASQTLVGNLPASSVTTAGNQTALQNFLRQTIEGVQAGDLEAAREKLRQAIERTDGCVLRGIPDGNGPGRDWILDCDAQASLYASLTAALEALGP